MTSAVTLSPVKRVRELLEVSTVQSAFRFFEVRAEEITKEHISICSIPAPPFGEEARSSYLCNRFRKIGLPDAGMDQAGNCIALRRGRSTCPLLVVSAHLDTVFPPETDFTVRRFGHRLFGPGVSDDGCGLAAILALAQACVVAEIETVGSLLFVGTVGEEGEGDLRGVRYLLTKGEWANRVDAFLSFDGPGADRITNGALGSRRYRVRLRGRGGHSWGDFGAANPVHALGRAVAKLASYPAPVKPRTTFNVGRIEGGAGVNVIPQEAVMDVDLRSVSVDELQRLDAFFVRSVQEAVDDENAACRRANLPLEVEVALIGNRPCGETPPDSEIVRIAEEATRLMGYSPRLDQASTDSNVPISLRIPAITLGAGGNSGSSHTLDEWYDPRGRDQGLKRALLILLSLVGIAKGV